MFPWNYGFHWNAGTILFLGAFYTVLVVILTTIANAAWRSWRDVRRQRVDAVRWEVDFHDLPHRDRACRHELTGELKHRECPNAFDCRVCDTHPKLVARQPAAEGDSTVEPDVFGLTFPCDRFYHRGHTWARPEPDGTVTVGLDDFGKRLLGNPDRIDLPRPGARVHVNGTAWRAQRRGAEVRVLSPVDGEVVETGGPDCDWYLKLKPAEGHFDLRHLLRPREVKPWMMRELERLQIAMGCGTPTLADGGVPVADVGAVCSAADWDTICGEIFLHP